MLAPRKGLRPVCENMLGLPVVRIPSLYLPGWPYATLRSFSFPVDLGTTVKKIMKKDSFQIIHVHGHHYPTSWLAIRTAKKLGIPSVLSLHGMYALNPNVLGGKSIIEEVFNKLIFARVLRNSSVVSGGTSQIISYARRYHSDDSKYVIIPSGVNTDLYEEHAGKKEEFRRKFNLIHDSTILLFVGRLEKVKGIITFCEAAKKLLSKHDNVEVVIVGTGSLYTQVNSSVGKIKKVHLLGWLPYSDLFKIYIAADVFILPSIFEALPLTILEAMNAGLHIIYTPVGGVEDILTGYYLKTKIELSDPGHIERAVTRFVNSGHNSVDRTESLAYARTFSWRRTALDFQNLYRRLSPN